MCLRVRGGGCGQLAAAGRFLYAQHDFIGAVLGVMEAQHEQRDEAQHGHSQVDHVEDQVHLRPSPDAGPSQQARPLTNAHQSEKPHQQADALVLQSAEQDKAPTDRNQASS